MVAFVFQVSLRGEELDRKLFSPPQEWPVLPRTGEWVHPDEELSEATPVLDVWHWMHFGKPCIVVELESFESHDFDALKTWTDKCPYL